MIWIILCIIIITVLVFLDLKKSKKISKWTITYIVIFLIVLLLKTFL